MDWTDPEIILQVPQGSGEVARSKLPTSLSEMIPIVFAVQSVLYRKLPDRALVPTASLQLMWDRLLPNC